MLDIVKLSLLAGDGGHGRVSFRREKYIPKGGPDGGPGGAGGSVILVGNKNLSTLGHLAGLKKIEAKPGENGGARKKYGADAEDVRVEVPVGTIVWLVAENQESYRGRMRAEESEGSRQFLVKMEQFWIEGGRGLIPPRPEDPLTPVTEYTKKQVHELPTPDKRLLLPKQEELELADFDRRLPTEVEESIQLIEITEHGQEVLVCQGGRGGRGNVSFAGPAHTTPWEAEYGQRGEKKEVVLELRLLADVGLVGFPNAGKSTFLSKITRANPKIANYPFTTLEPNLGIWLLSKSHGSPTTSSREVGRKSELVVADIPGLIEGASQGKGLGLKFLRHIQRCQVLLFMLALDETVTSDTTQDAASKAGILWREYQTLLNELKTYSPGLIRKPRQVVINKSDLYDKTLVSAIQTTFADEGVEVLFMSTITGEGLEAVKEALRTVF